MSRWALFGLLLCFVTPVSSSLDEDTRINRLIKAVEEYIEQRDKQNHIGKPSNGLNGAINPVDVYLARFNVDYTRLLADYALAEYTYETNITDYNEQQFSIAENALNSFQYSNAKRAQDFLSRQTTLTSDAERKLKLIAMKTDASANQTVNSHIISLRNSMTEIYNTARPGGKTLEHHEDVMQKSRDWQELVDTWKAWRDATGPKVKDTYAQFVEASNAVMRENGWEDIGDYWRTSDFENGDEIEGMVDDLFLEILPLYKELHAYVRRKLIDFYGSDRINETGHIPAHLLGNMWAQEWDGIFDLVKPFPYCTDPDVTSELKRQNYTVEGLFRMAEEFFTSLTLEPMTDTFWAESMMTRPEGRAVQCHASATELFKPYDYRIKMCGFVTEGDLSTIHHEMGHIEYFMQYSVQPAIYHEGANAAFHEAIGDTISLSVLSPQHLETVGLLDHSDLNPACHDTIPSDADINFLMKVALTKVAFLPFGYLLDKYRWAIFSGAIDKEHYNTMYWHMREVMQGVEAPVPRSEQDLFVDREVMQGVEAPVPRSEQDLFVDREVMQGVEAPVPRSEQDLFVDREVMQGVEAPVPRSGQDFDAGAKFHMVAHVPYMRYFLAHISQFQFLKAMCDAAGHQWALHKCDVYGSHKAGQLLKSMLKLGLSTPWPEAMQVMTNQRQFATSAMYEYFAPLYDWLKVQNRNEHKGWS